MLGMVERGGRVRLRVITSRRGEPLSGAVRANVNPDSIIFTDDWRPYRPLGREYAGHRVINHSAGVYVRGDVHTNTIEGFFGNLKTGMRGAYKAVSQKWLQSYLDEYAWRYNDRFRGDRSMFHSLLDEAAKMSEQAAILRSIRSAAKRREKADAAKREATDDLRRYCEAARVAGVSITQIASEAGLSRQGVYDLLAERP